MRPEVVFCPNRFSVVARNLHICIKINDTDGKICKNCFTSLIALTRSGERDGSRIGFFINSIGGGEVFVYDHMFQLPMVYVVKINYRINGLNRFNFGSNHIHPKDRTKIESVFLNESRIGGYKLDCGGFYARIHIKQADDGGFIACVIVNLELDAVEAVGNRQIRNGNLAVFIYERYFHAIHISFRRRCIEAGIVVQGMLCTRSVKSVGCFGNVCNYIEFIILYGEHVMLAHIHFDTIVVDNHGLKNGSFTVFYRFRIVYCYIVYVVGERTVDRAVGLPQNIVNGFVENENKEEFIFVTGIWSIGRVSVKGRGVGQINLFKIAQVHGQIMPSGFVYIIVNVFGVHKIDLRQSVGNTIVVGIVLIEALNPALNIVLGNVEPESERACVLKRNLLVFET